MESKRPLMKPVPAAPNLYLIALDPDLPGFTEFIGAWLYKGEKTFLVDAGPAATVKKLVNLLNILEIKHLDAVFLTHIHIDHAGGIGDLAARFPEAPIICHSAAIRHLEDPTRLWEGSLKALGPIAEAYGSIKPVPRKSLIEAEGFSDYGVTAISTPGHSPHHMSYLFGPFLFAGEAGGVFIDLSGGDFYLRPATPARFFLQTSIQSIDLLMQTEHDRVCYGHFGITRQTPLVFKAHRQQIFVWEDVIQREMGKNRKNDLVKRCLSKLLAVDPLLAGWNRLGQAVQERECFFLRNSINGFIQYIEAGCCTG